MELLGKQTLFVHLQRVSSAASLGSLSCSPSCCCVFRSDVLPSRWAFSSKLLLPRISEGVSSRSSGGKCISDCGVWKWIWQSQEQRLVKPGVEATATISAARRSSSSARRRSTSRRPEGSGGFNLDLELEILAFMLLSGKSDVFPSKEELISAGRLDLVEAIIAEGGWLVSGWEKKANGSVVGGGIQEVSLRPLSRQRALRNKTKVVRSRRSRGRPKLVERRSLSITNSPGETSKPDEPEKDAIKGQTDDQKIDTPRDGNGTDGAAKLERVEKCQATSPMFEQVRKDPGSRFPSISRGYRLWEFESLAAFIENRKLDAKNGSMQRQQMGLCSNSSVRKKRLDPEAAKRRRELCERRWDAASKLCRKSSKCDNGTSVKKHLVIASPVKQDTRVDEAVNPQAELETSTSIEQDTRINETVIPEAQLDAATTIEHNLRVDEALNPETELEAAPTGVQVTRFDDAMNPQAHFTGSTLDSNVGKNLEDTPAFITPVAEQDSGAEGGTSSHVHLEAASTGQQEGREPIVEREGKLKKKNKKRTKMEESEDVCQTPEKLSEALDWINQMVEQREKWMLEVKSGSLEGPPMPMSIQDRIRSLEDRLYATRTALQSRREALGQKGDGLEQPNSPSDVHTRRLAELREASDELEYTENKIFKVSRELSTTLREVAALEGACHIELTDVRNAAGENEKRIAKAKTSSQSLRAVRIVWPHPAQEVFLIGSFDGWNEKIKMKLSGAGVFVVSLPLSPGSYEIKFIVDGTWRVDTERPIVYVGGYENNVLTVPEQFTFGWRK